VKAQILLPDGSYARPNSGEAPFDAQAWLLQPPAQDAPIVLDLPTKVQS
jgi:hypothetical protein